MPSRVYTLPARERARLEAALGDDILSRQSITLRDARHFGHPGDALYVFIEGSEQGVYRADELLGAIAQRAPDETALLQRLKAEEDDAATGLGSIFG